jgi:hypothetical protein
MQALLKLLDNTTIAHQTAVIKQWIINQQELNLYILQAEHINKKKKINLIH